MKHVWIPVLERTAETDEEKAELNMVKNWLDIGYIPRKDFPDDTTVVGNPAIPLEQFKEKQKI